MTIFIYIWKADNHISGVGLYPSDDTDRVLSLEYQVEDKKAFQSVLDGLVYENGQLVVKPELKYVEPKI